MKVGVLALQGDVREHAHALRESGATPVEVRHAAQLDDVDGLVIPGGESTTIGKLMDRFSLRAPLIERAREGLPLYGTCAGLILMAKEVVGEDPAPHRLGVLDVAVRRNGYGRQVESFESDLEWAEDDQPFRAVFIRAPIVESVGGDVEVLARHKSHPVLVRQGRLLGSTFHPEMTGDGRVHSAFVDIIKEA